MEWRNREDEERSDESEDYDSEPEDTSRYRLHWSTPRAPDFKKVLDAKRCELHNSPSPARPLLSGVPPAPVPPPWSSGGFSGRCCAISRFEEREEAKAAREMEAKEAWKALNGGSLVEEEQAGKEGAKEGAEEEEQHVDAEAVKRVLATFDLKVDLSEIGLEGNKDASGKDVISFQKFRDFTSLTPREREDDMTVGRTVGGTLQMHPGSPVKGAAPLR